jgi:hypothetical protein
MPCAPLRCSSRLRAGRRGRRRGRPGRGALPRRAARGGADAVRRGRLERAQRPRRGGAAAAAGAGGGVGRQGPPRGRCAGAAAAAGWAGAPPRLAQTRLSSCRGPHCTCLTPPAAPRRLLPTTPLLPQVASSLADMLYAQQKFDDARDAVAQALEVRAGVGARGGRSRRPRHGGGARRLVSRQSLCCVGADPRCRLVNHPPQTTTPGRRGGRAVRAVHQAVQQHGRGAAAHGEPRRGGGPRSRGEAAGSSVLPAAGLANSSRKHGGGAQLSGFFAPLPLLPALRARSSTPRRCRWRSTTSAPPTPPPRSRGECLRHVPPALRSAALPAPCLFARRPAVPRSHLAPRPPVPRLNQPLPAPHPARSPPARASPRPLLTPASLPAATSSRHSTSWATARARGRC